MKFYVHYKDADSDIVCAVDTSEAICVSDFLQVCLMNKFLLAKALTQTMLQQNVHRTGWNKSINQSKKINQKPII